jgi:hypothetical protein
MLDDRREDPFESQVGWDLTHYACKLESVAEEAGRSQEPTSYVDC